MKEILISPFRLMICRFNAKKESVKLSFFICTSRLAKVRCHKRRTALEASLRLETVGRPSRTPMGLQSFARPYPSFII